MSEDSSFVELAALTAQMAVEGIEHVPTISLMKEDFSETSSSDDENSTTVHISALNDDCLTSIIGHLCNIDDRLRFVID